MGGRGTFASGNSVAYRYETKSFYNLWENFIVFLLTNAETVCYTNLVKASSILGTLSEL